MLSWGAKPRRWPNPPHPVDPAPCEKKTGNSFTSIEMAHDTRQPTHTPRTPTHPRPLPHPEKILLRAQGHKVSVTSLWTGSRCRRAALLLLMSCARPFVESLVEGFLSETDLTLLWQQTGWLFTKHRVHYFFSQLSIFSCSNFWSWSASRLLLLEGNLFQKKLARKKRRTKHELTRTLLWYFTPFFFETSCSA